MVFLDTYLGRRRVCIKFSLKSHQNRAEVSQVRMMNQIPNNKIAQFDVNMTLTAFPLQSADGFSCFKRDLLVASQSPISILT